MLAAVGLPRARIFDALKIGAAVAAIAAASAFAPACSVGAGEGSIQGTLNVPDCWTGQFSLAPDFFGGTPFQRTLDIRVQEGGDYVTYSDGIHILVRDIDAILGTASNAGLLGSPIAVRIPAEVTPPGVPVEADPSPSLIDFSLYLQRTCKTQNDALYAGTVTLNDDGTCDAATAGAPFVCPTSANATIPAVTTAASTITFYHLFNGIPEESDAAKRLTEAKFDVYLADPREICPGGLGPPPHCRGHLTGSFRFIFERGRPAQRFP